MNLLKMIIQELLPKSIIETLRVIKHFFPLLWNTLYWMWHDLCYSASVKHNQKENFAELMIVNHVLEKGITMPERRLGFGYEIVRGIIKSCRKYIKDYTQNHIEIQIRKKKYYNYKTEIEDLGIEPTGCY